MTSSTPYIPDLSGWIDYYGQQAGHNSGEIKLPVQAVPTTPAVCVHKENIEKESTAVDNIDSNPEPPVGESSGEADMGGTDIQLVTPVQAAVAQAKAIKKRRRSEKAH